MYIRSLQLKGFKSFEQKTELIFEPGISAIVGPNGSGKSNIVDALLWVMGEQSTGLLRSDSMDEVIFSGSGSKAALGRAEVELVIDNSDHGLDIEFSEVSIKRILFQSSGSQYFINQQQVRLIDVQDLLSDVNLGRQMHTIVGQGRIDTIINSNAQMRRQFIEEAAGILKYKGRKDKALRKLEGLSSNLVRVEDLIAELNRQMAPLGRQAKLARQSFQLNESIFEITARLNADDFLRQENLLKIDEGKIAKIENDVANKQRAFDDESKKLNALKDELAHNDPKLKSLGEAANKLREQKSESLEIRNSLQIQINNLQNQALPSQDSQIAALQNQNATIASQIASENARIETLQSIEEQAISAGAIASFLISISPQGVALTNAIEPAGKHIKIDTEFAAILEPIISNIYIAQSDGDAENFSKANSDALVISKASGKSFTKLSNSEIASKIESRDLKGEIEEHKKAVGELEKSIAQNEAAIAKASKTQEDAEAQAAKSRDSEIEKLAAKLQEVENASQQIDEAVASAEAAQNEALNDFAKNNLEISKLLDSINKSSNAISDLKDELHNIELSKNAIEINQQVVQEKLDSMGIAKEDIEGKFNPANAFKIYDNIKNEFVELKFDRDKQMKMLDGLQANLQALGKINPLAVEEYEALSERQEFLQNQLDDLTNSKNELLSLAADMDQRITAAFKDAFDSTAKEFKEIVPQLFPGGNGKILLDSNDLLTAGIEIEITPAGKKIKNLSLLSGGERSLASLALLLAIFKARPSPFYVLDEVEAALDESNLNRLLTALQQLQAKAQLIIITHQKPTMAISDVLYGISMNSEGISKVISYSLNR